MAKSDSMKDQEHTLYQSILDDIFSGKISGGDRLKVSALAEQYGLSASPVREVLRQMQGEGFVEILPNRGAVVVSADANTIQNIFEVLQLLEPYFVKWFAEYALPEMLEELAEIHAKIIALGDRDLIEFRRLDFEFHGVISRHHYNDAAADTWNRLRRALNVHAAQLRISPARMKTIVQEHEDLLGAFQANDASRACSVIQKHVHGSFEQMSQQMRALGIRYTNPVLPRSNPS
jgi:DNA-binding GntR family transcriptional regulator